MEKTFSPSKMLFLDNYFLILQPETRKYYKYHFMKNIFSLISMLLCVLSVCANDYTDKLTVTVNGVSMEQQATITITQGEDGKYTFSLKNFCLESAEDDGTVTRLGVGNIVLADREGTTVDGVTTITYNDGLVITEGDDPNIEMWMGPAISAVAPVPVEMVARFNETQLYCEIHINLEILDQVIDVVFGNEPTASTNGTEYTDKLTVTVNGVSMEQQATITIAQGEDGKYTFSLKNFCLESAEDDGTVTRLGVGNIVLADREGTTVDGVTTITYNDGLVITEGDDPNIEMWMGPAISAVAPVPVEMVARFNETQLYCEIHINLEILEQVIDVVFGNEPTTGINGLSATGTKNMKRLDGTAYDMQGRKVGSLRRHSLYIVDGKKIWIK